ncbi:MAG: AMP-binding protein [Oscillospiraceae bacterium]|nr:AMP-binding protein [Oscillospiraceae bacterium]
MKEDFRNIFEREYTWIEGYMRSVRRFSGKLAMLCPESGDGWTYSELNREANKLAHAFMEDGVKKGDVIMYLLLNCPAFVFAYVAAHKLCAVNCPANYRLSAGEIAMNIDDSRPVVLFFEGEQADEIMRAVEMAEHKPKRLIVVDRDEVNGIPGAISYQEYVKDKSEAEPVIPYEHNIYDETTRLYTSGTTGRQKGVPLTSINEVLSSHDVMIHFPMNHTDKTMNTTPWFHRGGLHCAGPCPTLYAGATLYIMRKFNADKCLEYVEKYGLTFIIGVPTVLEALADSQDKNGRDLSSLRGVVTMGSALERAACIRYQKTLTPNIFNGYGTTETFWNTFLRPFDLPEYAGTAGGSCVDDEVRVIRIFDDRRGEPDELAAMDGTEVGEVIIKSPAKSPYAYFNNEDESEKKFYKGFIYTNDLATWIDNSYVTIVGRKDDMIISSGENIYPTQVEEVLNSHPKVKDCIVTAAPDKMRGELVTAYIVRTDESLSYEELDEFCKESPMIANYKRPRYYRFINEIPLNVTGKKLHYKAKYMAAEDLRNGFLYRV